MKIGKTKPILIAAVAVVAAAALLLFLKAERIEEGRCKLVRKKADASSQLLGFAQQVLQPQAAKPEGVPDLPAGFGRPCYYLVKSAGRQVPLVVNLSEGKSCLCMDLNGDGQFSPDECFTPTHIAPTKIRSESLRFGPIRPVSQDPSSEANGGFYVDGYRLTEPESLVVFPAYFRTGKLRLDGRTYRVAVVDGDCDSRFRSILSLPLDHSWRLPESDVLAIDLDGNGEFEISSQRQSEVMPMGRLTRVGDAYYTIEIAPDGMSLSLSKAQPQFGTLVMEPNDTTATLNLWSDTAGQYLPSGRQWKLPAGKYSAESAGIEKEDGTGSTWLFSCATNTAIRQLGPLDFFVIEPGQTTRVQLGPPFQIKVSVGKSGQAFSIGAELQGRSGELYSLAALKDGRRPAKASLQIVDEAGRIMESGKFEYG
jgi:hypothetical protein